MRIILDEVEKLAYLNATASGLFNEEAILKNMIDVFEIELVEETEQDDDESDVVYTDNIGEIEDAT